VRRREFGAVMTEKKWGDKAKKQLTVDLRLEDGEGFYDGLTNTLHSPTRFSDFRKRLEESEDCPKPGLENPSRLHGHPSPCASALNGLPCGRSLATCLSGMMGWSSRAWRDGECHSCSQKCTPSVTLPTTHPSRMRMFTYHPSRPDGVVGVDCYATPKAQEAP